MLTLTPLERGVLDAICTTEALSIPALRDVLVTAVVISRKNTGHGFYTQFKTATWDGVAGRSMIDGPCFHLPDVGNNAMMCFILWYSGDRLMTLEGFQMGDANGATVDLQQWNLATLRFAEIGTGT